MVSAIVLAAGSGKRMGSDIPKQYLELCGKPLLVYSLETFDESDVDEIVLVVSPGDISYCKKEIVEKFHIKKVMAIVEGGAERYDSVAKGLACANGDYVLIHDGARAFVTTEIIKRCIASVKQTNACIVGVPCKDTIKRCSEDGFVKETPDRSTLWSVQTPQCFLKELIVQAYDRLDHHLFAGITDDAMIVEMAMDVPIKMILGDYNNIKITTPEDMALGEIILENTKK